jgi:hypothetical protein
LKKFITISLLVLFCLNILGYRIIAHYYANKSSAELQVSLDQNKYKESELVSFKIPLNQPYIINTDGYESLEGNMDYNGMNYQFVKKRILNDTLEIVCIPNNTRTQIDNNKEDFTKQLADIVNTSTSKKSQGIQQLKFSFTDFTQEHHFELYPFVASATLKHASKYEANLSFDYLQNIAKPPQA